MPKPYPREFRDDVVAVARKGHAPLSQIARDFGISEGSLTNWLKKADIEDGNRPGLSDDERQQLREDISEHPTREGKLYICAIKDVWSNRIVGYSIDTRMTSSLARAAMRNAIALRSPAGTVCHSDRGGQFRAKRTQQLLANNGLIGSMGRSYGAGDNASMESFFSLLQKNVLNTRRWDSREDLRLAIVTGIETNTTVAAVNADSES